MELKRSRHMVACLLLTFLLIVPYGIETLFFDEIAVGNPFF